MSVVFANTLRPAVPESTTSPVRRHKQKPSDKAKGHRHPSLGSAAGRHADRHYRALRAGLNASEGNAVDRMFSSWRIRYRVHCLRAALRDMGVAEHALPPLRRAFVQREVPVAITDVTWHEQLRQWWWPDRLLPDIDP